MTQNYSQQKQEQEKHHKPVISQISPKNVDHNDMNKADGNSNDNVESQLQPSTHPSQNPTTNSRSRSRRNALLPKNTTCITITKTKTKKSRKATKEDTCRSLQFIWICVECKEAECVTHPDSPLLVCEGPCSRPFHYPCAGLPSVPPSDETWVCNDCINRRHECCVCHEYGYDGVDVHKCDKRDCGLFYHEACLSMYDVDIMQEKIMTPKKTTTGNDTNSSNDSGNDIGNDSGNDIGNDSGNDSDNDSDNKNGISNDSIDTDEMKEDKNHFDDNDEITKKNNTSCTVVTTVTRPKFVCPAHACWTCSGGPPPVESSSNPQNESNDKKEQQQQKKGKQKRSKKKCKKSYNVFTEKKGDLFRCLKCPNAYHISCIPPSCKFHELALLCHEHASSSKLPFLDVETSCQKEIENRADEMMKEAVQSKRQKRKQSYNNNDNIDHYDDDLVSKRKKMMSSNLKKQNPFFLGKSFTNGEVITPYENKIMDLLSTAKDADFQNMGCSKRTLSSFCLPCGIQEEVYLKPPVYTHIHYNRYDPNHRPKRHAPTGEVCRCAKVKSAEKLPQKCDEQCMNRILGIECIGDGSKKGGEKNPYWNCDCGPECSNRMLSQKKSAKCRPKRQQGKGWGLISLNGISKGALVQEYVGEIIDEKMKRERLETWSKDHPNDPNFYIMKLESGWYIDAREKGNLSRFINHSCEPSCHLLPVNVSENMRVAVVASRDILPGEFLTYDYHFDTQDGDKFVCRCGAKKCRGTMKGGQRVLDDDNDKKMNKSERWIAAKSKLDRDKKFLEDIKKGEKMRLNQICLTVPGDNGNNSNLVASGPELSNILQGRKYSVCLKRNLIKGSNFYSRYNRMKSKGKKSIEK